jgi:beta-N-acetylhexosaminidase
VILFARNLDTPPATADLVRSVVTACDRPLLLAIDQEGGPVSRLERWIGPTPPASEVARSDAELAGRLGRGTGAVLRALGLNVNFAPVVDLCEPDAQNGIGARAFGTDPKHVSDLAGQYLDGLQSTGVAWCLKHFPGLGATSCDTHLALATDPRPLAALEARDLVPFAALGPRAAAVMVGHGHYPAVDPAVGRPASQSRAIVHGLLRVRLGFRGLVATDDLEMGAVPPSADGEVALAAIEAGCDLALYCSDLARAERAIDELDRRAERDEPLARRLAEAAAAVGAVARRFPATAAPPSDWDTACRDLKRALANA